MRYRHAVRGAVPAAILTLAALAALPVRAAAQAPDDVRLLGWMAGCWELRTATRVTHEQWMAPLGGMMMGMSRTVVAGAVREHESLRIQTVDGRLTYLAQPSGQGAAAFQAVTISDSTVAFANPLHDFPQRIAYRRNQGGDSLVARIEGERAGTVRGIDFPMRRVECSDPAVGGSDPKRSSHR